jgi:hypothetical protein
LARARDLKLMGTFEKRHPENPEAVLGFETKTLPKEGSETVMLGVATLERCLI